MKNIIANKWQWIPLVLGLVGSANRLDAAQVYNESGGLVIMEIENTESPLGLWQNKTSLTPFTGSGYLEFTGNNYSGGDPESPLKFHFKIEQGGTYLIDLRCARIEVDGRDDLANDCYVRVVGDFTSPPGPHDVPGAPASLSMLKTDMKYYGGNVNAWEWASGDRQQSGGRLDPGGKKNKRTALYNFKSGETYTLVISGRSKSFRADRVMFRRESVPAASAQDLTRAESKTTEGAGPVPDDLDITIHATDFTAESNPDSDTIIKKNGTTDVGAIQNDSWIRFDDFDFGAGAGSCVEIQASCSGDGGSVELRTDSETGTLLGTVAIRKTWKWGDNAIFSGNLTPASGAKNLYLVFKGGAGDLFNIQDFTIRSGESVQEKPAKLPIRPPAGRLAIVADGNSSDPDDIGATAVALAMLRVTGLDKRLVHASHSCDLVKASNTSDQDELRRQQLLQTVCDGTVSRWGGFEGITFWNCRTQQTEAVNDLRDAINASSESDPLWIIEAGEPDIIGYALEAAEPSKRKFVKLVTHSPINDGSGDYFKWNQIEKLIGEIVRIPDQNGANYARLGDGLQRPLWAYYWARDHKDSRVNWLWEQVKIAEQDKVVAFQKNKCDISDAGMVLYWITGANVNQGYRTPDMDDVRQLF